MGRVWDICQPAAPVSVASGVHGCSRAADGSARPASQRRVGFVREPALVLDRAWRSRPTALSMESFDGTSGAEWFLQVRIWTKLYRFMESLPSESGLLQDPHVRPLGPGPGPRARAHRGFLGESGRLSASDLLHRFTQGENGRSQALSLFEGPRILGVQSMDS